MTYRLEHDFHPDDDEQVMTMKALRKVCNALEDALHMLDKKFGTVRWRKEYTFDETLQMGRLIEDMIYPSLWPEEVRAVHPVREKKKDK